jgi:hypothetical protein
MEIFDLIVKHAENHIGFREIPGNQGFRDKLFEERMREISGWYKGAAWCAFFVELMWREVYRQIDENIDKELEELFSASATKTWDNFLNSPRWIASKYPVRGSVVIWQKYYNGKPNWRGHAALLVEKLSSEKIKTIEGNTNTEGSREGQVVAEKTRTMNFNDTNGLVMKGFIHPRQILKKIEHKQIKL